MGIVSELYDCIHYKNGICYCDHCAGNAAGHDKVGEMPSQPPPPATLLHVYIYSYAVHHEEWLEARF